MNINIKPQENPFLIQNNNKFKSTLQTGSIITGIITSKDTNNTIIKFDNNAKLNIDSTKVDGATGTKVSFEVLDSSNNKLVLKQIKTVDFKEALASQQQLKDANIKELYEKNGFAQDLSNSDENSNAQNTTEEQKIDLAMIMLRRKLKYGNANNSKSTLSALISSGIDISKVSLSTISKVVSSTKANAVPDKTPKEMEDLQQSFIKKGFSTSEISTKMNIAENLNSNGIAVTDANIEQIEKFLSDVKELQNSHIDTNNLLKNNRDISLKNLLSSKHNNLQKTQDLPKDLDKEISSLLKTINIDPSSENIDIAKNFIANEIEVTEENFNKFNFIENELKTLDTTALIQKAIEQIRASLPLSEINLSDLDIASAPIDYASKLTQLNEVGYNTISHLNSKDMPITIDNLIDNIQAETSENVITQSMFVTKKQILEIQLRMTSNVMFTLNKNNIDISTQPLLNALNSIKQAENEVYENTLSQMNAVVNTENKSLLADTMDTIIDAKSTIGALQGNSLQGLFNKISSVSNLLPELYNKENLINLTNISTHMSKVALAYDDSVSTPNAKFNDNFSNILDQIAPMLENMNIIPTDSKVKATSVLIKNNIDVTKEAIEEVEAINLKIETLLEKLTPHIASKMLSEGMNPLTENIDTMLNYIDTFNDLYGTNLDDNLAKALIKMEKDKDIDEETLKGIKAIYRALNTINKNGLSSVGSYIDTNRSLTLNSLIDSAKIYSQNKGKHNILNKAIDDTTSISQKFTVGESIKDLINKNVAPERTYEYEQIARFIYNANYEGLKQLITENPDVYDEILQNVTDRLIELNKTQNTNDLDFLQKVVDEVLNSNPETISQLAKSNLPVNKKNLDTLNKMKEDKNYASKTFQELFSSEDIELSEVTEGFYDDYKYANDTFSNILQNENIDITHLQLYGEVMNILSMQNALNNSGELAYKSYPIKLPNSGEITNLQMYLLDEDAFNKIETTIAFALNLSNGGEVNATAKFNSTENTLDVNIVCENEAFSNILENNKDELINIFKEMVDTNIITNLSIS